MLRAQDRADGAACEGARGDLSEPAAPAAPAGPAATGTAAAAGSGNGKASSTSTSENMELHMDERLASGVRSAPFGSRVPPASVPPRLARAGGGGGGGELVRVTLDSKERLRWSAELHAHFCQAVADLGGSSFAKPKDIVTKMGVQGLTLAHVKSHLQKHRAQQGVAYVQHYARAATPFPTRHDLQQQPEQEHMHSNAPLGGCSGCSGGGGGGGGSSDSEGAPPSKRPRASSLEADHVARGAAPRASSMPPFAGEPAAPGSGDGSSDRPRLPPPRFAGAAAARAAPFQPYLSALSGAAQPPHLPLPLLPHALPRQPLAAAMCHEAPPPAAVDKLRALADLAVTQHEVMEALALPMEHHASALTALQGRLEAAASLWQQRWQQQQTPPQQQLLLQLDGLLEQQRCIQQHIQQHVEEQGLLLAELAAFRRVAEGLLSLPLLGSNAQADAPLMGRQQQEQRMAAPAPMFAEGAWQQPQHCRQPQQLQQLEQQQAQRVPGDHVGTAAQLALLLNLIGASQSRPATPAPPQQPAPPPAHAAPNPLAQLQQLCHDAALLADKQPVEALPVTSNE